MPLKDLESSQFYFLDNGEYKPLGHIDDLELTLSATDEQQEDYHKYFLNESIEIEMKICNVESLMIYLRTGNDLYLRFPKKLRRRKRR